MAAELKILFIEDLPTDVEFAKRTLSKEGIVYQSRVVDTEADFLHELEKFSPDIIISDYKMPKFDGMRALNLTLEKCPSTPFILLTGSVNEEIAVECMKSGATDYIIKEHIARLPMAIKDALEKNKIILEKEKIAQALKENEDRYRDLIENSSDLICTHDLDGNILSVNSAALKITGYSQEEVLKMNMQNMIVPEYRKIFNAYLNKIQTVGHAQGLMIIQTKTGERRIWEYNNSLRTHGIDKPIVRGMVKDITERKQAEERTKAYVHFLESLDRIDRVIKKEVDIEPMLWSVVNTVFSIFDCDRAWLFYPCDPDVQSFRVPVEVYKHEYPGANVKNIDVPMSPDLADNLREALELSDVVTYLTGTDRPINKVTAEQFGVQSQMMVPIYPKIGKPWVFGMHQCSHARVWTNDERQLFKEISRRVADSLTNLLMLQNLKESEERWKLLLNESPLPYAINDNYGNITFVSIKFIETFGYNLQDIPTLEQWWLRAYPNEAYRKIVVSELEKELQKSLDMGTLIKPQEWKTTDKYGIVHDIKFHASVHGKDTLVILDDITERKRAEEALLKSEAELKEAQRVGRFGSWDWDATTDTIIWSEEYYRIYGFDPKQNPPGYEEHLKIYTRESAALLDAAVKKSMQTGEEYQLDLEFALMAGTTRWVTAHGEVRYDNKGKIVGLRGTAQDITERKRAEEALLESEEKFRNLASSAKDSIIMMDDEGKFFYWNEAFEKLFQFKSSEITGKAVHALIAPKRFHDDYEKGFAKYLETGEGPAVGKVLELAAIKKNGEEFPVELSLSTFMLRGKRMSLGILRDIYERKHAEEEIVMLAHSLRSINECVSITDIEDKILFVNESFLKTYGYDESELVGKHMSIVRSLNNPPELVKEILPTTLLGGWQGELWNKRKDGSEFQISLSTTIIRDKSGKAIALIGVATDITERKRAEKELINAKEKAEEMSRLKTNFLANMSHELRTPLNGIMGYADILASSIDDPGQNEMAQGIYQSGKRLSETLNFILDLSEAETDRIEVIAKDVEVIPLVKNSINSIAKEAAERNLQLETIIKEENIFVHLDEHLFTRILHNLLDNAIKFTNKGEIIVEIGKEIIDEKDWLYIKIKDTGIGIASDKIDLIWDEFRQVSEGLTRSYEGAGLGLTISKKAVELMQGDISVESELGVGSTFTVKFPAVSVIPQIEKVVKEKQAVVIQPEKEKAETTGLPLALCVEDDFANRNVIKFFLKNTCIIDMAEDAAEAIQLAAEKKYDLVLMDINLGGEMNGMEVVQEILKIPQYFSTPIIAVTAYAMGKDKAEFLRGGCTHYISKPFQKHELINLVTGVLNNN